MREETRRGETMRDETRRDETMGEERPCEGSVNRARGGGRGAGGGVRDRVRVIPCGPVRARVGPCEPV